MIKTLKYYQGCTSKQLFRYIIYLPLKTRFFKRVYSIWMPNEVTIKTPLSCYFKILSKTGFDYSRAFPITNIIKKHKWDWLEKWMGIN